MFVLLCGMQLALDSLDRLVDTLEERGPLTAVEAARSLFATPSISEGLASSLLGELTAGDSRVACVGGSVALADARVDPELEEAEFVVFDLETPGLSPARDRICELGAVRVRGLELVDSFESLVNPGVALPEPVARLTGLPAGGVPRAGRPTDRPAAGGSAGGPAGRGSRAPLPRVRGRRAARRAQRRLRPALPRAAARHARRAAPVRAAALHGRSRAPPARGAPAPRRSRLAGQLLRRADRAVPSRPARRRGDGAGARAPDRPQPGARRAAALRAARAGGATQAPGLRQA